MKRKIAFFGFIFLYTLVLAQGNLLVNPIRVVFEGSKQTQDLNLSNIGKDSAVYLVSFVHYLMKEDGRFEQLEKPDTTFSADKFLRLFPRKVVLPPGESQTIRLQLRKPSNLKQGEYRTHIYFRAEKETSPLGMQSLTPDSSKMAVRITPVFGISIPVIVRNGNLTNKVTLSEPQLTALNDSISRCTVAIHRTGLKSAYGNLIAEFHPVTGPKVEIGIANGVGIYPEISKRYFSFLIHNKFIKNNAGKIVIRFMAASEDGGAEISRTLLPVNPTK